jgi:hypothetical protein
MQPLSQNTRGVHLVRSVVVTALFMACSLPGYECPKSGVVIMSYKFRARL